MLGKVAILKWRPQSRKDLEAIEAYLEEVSPDYAPFFMERIQQHSEKTQENSQEWGESYLRLVWTQ